MLIRANVQRAGLSQADSVCMYTGTATLDPCLDGQSFEFVDSDEMRS